MTEISYIDWSSMTDDRIAQQIGVFIRHHRMMQNKTQAMLAKDAGISRSTLSLLERGETVTVATLIQVLRVLDQLHVINGFIVTQQQSPLLLAQVEKKKKRRVFASRKKSVDNNEETDW